MGIDNSTVLDEVDEGAKLEGACHCGATGWSLEGDPGSITACNCTLCRRYGALWAYDFEDVRIRLRGESSSYVPQSQSDRYLEIRSCQICACVLCWRGLRLEPGGRRRIAVNVRLAHPDAVAALAIDHFDGLNSFEDLPSDGKCVRDLWF